jgi:hypothetical protein
MNITTLPSNHAGIGLTISNPFSMTKQSLEATQAQWTTLRLGETVWLLFSTRQAQQEVHKIYRTLRKRERHGTF